MDKFRISSFRFQYCSTRDSVLLQYKWTRSNCCFMTWPPRIPTRHWIKRRHMTTTNFRTPLDKGINTVIIGNSFLYARSAISLHVYRSLYRVTSERGPKVTSLVARSSRCAQYLHDVCGLHDAHHSLVKPRASLRDLATLSGARSLRFTPDTRHIRESDTNFARTSRARSTQQAMLLLDPSIYNRSIYWPVTAIRTPRHVGLSSNGVWHDFIQWDLGIFRWAKLHIFLDIFTRSGVPARLD
jgi:hypothetical protein